MELKDYTIEELKAEIKRRNSTKKLKSKNHSNLYCIRCKFFHMKAKSPGFWWIKVYECEKADCKASPYKKACDKYESI